MELLAFLSEEFAVELPDDVLMSDEFSTIDGIAAVICCHGAAGLIEPKAVPGSILPSLSLPR